MGTCYYQVHWSRELWQDDFTENEGGRDYCGSYVAEFALEQSGSRRRMFLC